MGRLVGDAGQVPEQPVDAVQFLREVVLSHFKAQLPTGLLLQMVGLVDDEVLVICNTVPPTARSASSRAWFTTRMLADSARCRAWRRKQGAPAAE